MRSLRVCVCPWFCFNDTALIDTSALYFIPRRPSSNGVVLVSLRAEECIWCLIMGAVDSCPRSSAMRRLRGTVCLFQPFITTLMGWLCTTAQAEPELQIQCLIYIVPYFLMTCDLFHKCIMSEFKFNKSFLLYRVLFRCYKENCPTSTVLKHQWWKTGVLFFSFKNNGFKNLPNIVTRLSRGCHLVMWPK